MLAHRYPKKQPPYPCYVQPKLNGLRAIYFRGRFISRDQHFWNPPVVDHLFKNLTGLPDDIVLDGELYKHGWSLQQINSAIAVKRTEPTEKTAEVEFHVFDCFSVHDMLARQKKRFDLLTFAPVPDKVEPILIKDKAEGDYWFRKFVEAGYEGMMYRDPEAPYGFVDRCGNQENRWGCLLKRKEWLDEDYQVVGVEEGKGELAGMVGALVLELEDGQQFRAGSGLTRRQRQEFWHDPPKRAKIKYEMLSDTGVPLKPIVLLAE